MRVVGWDCDDADDDVLLADRVGQATVVADGNVANRPPHLVGVGVEDGRDVDPVLGEDGRARDRLSEPARADQGDVVLSLSPQDLADLAEERIDVVADPALPEFAECREVAPDLGRIDVRVVGYLL